MTNRNHALRTETLTERRLKRQLRRFITLETVCEKQALALCRTSGNWHSYIDAKRLNFQIAAYRWRITRRMIARTPQERVLRQTYDQIMKVVNAYRASRFAGTDTNLSRLVNISKQALHATRRDKE